MLIILDILHISFLVIFWPATWHMFNYNKIIAETDNMRMQWHHIFSLLLKEVANIYKVTASINYDLVNCEQRLLL